MLLLMFVIFNIDIWNLEASVSQQVWVWQWLKFSSFFFGIMFRVGFGVGIKICLGVGNFGFGVWVGHCSGVGFSWGKCLDIFLDLISLFLFLLEILSPESWTFISFNFPSTLKNSL